MFTNQGVGRLEKDLRSAQTRVREEALRAITGLDPIGRAALLAVHNTAFSPMLLGALFALDAGATLHAQSLERVAVETLARALGDRRAERRKAARTALVHGNVSLAAAHPILAELTRDRRRAVRAAVGLVFVWGNWLETSDVGLVEEMLRDPWLRGVGATTAAQLLRRLLTAITSAVALPAGKSLNRPLTPIRRGDHVHALVQGLRALPGLGSSLVAALRSRDPLLRASAVRGLDEMGAAAAGATPALVRALGDRDSTVSNAACAALRALERVVDMDGAKLRALLRSRLPHVRANALRCVPFARTTPPGDWQVFMRALEDPVADVRAAAAETLRDRYKAIPPKLLARLRRMAVSRSLTYPRMSAAHSLAQLAAGDASAVATAIASLAAGLRAPDARVRIAASWALSCLGKNAVSALPDLLRVAGSDPDSNVRSRAVWAFEAMGPRARRAVPVLRRLLRDPNEHVRRFAGRALASVQSTR